MPPAAGSNSLSPSLADCVSWVGFPSQALVETTDREMYDRIVGVSVAGAHTTGEDRTWEVGLKTENALETHSTPCYVRVS